MFMDLEGKGRARLVGCSSHVNWRRCFMPAGWGRPSGLLSWRPDLAGVQGRPAALSTHHSPPFQGLSVLRDTRFVFHDTQSPSQLPHSIPCSPKVPTLVTGMD